MIKVSVGQKIKKKNSASGKKKDGAPWYRYSIYASETSADSITIFAANPEDVMRFRSDEAEIVEIRNVSRRTIKGEKRYFTDVAVTAVLKEIVGMTINDLRAVDDSELPFM